MITFDTNSNRTSLRNTYNEKYIQTETHSLTIWISFYLTYKKNTKTHPTTLNTITNTKTQAFFQIHSNTFKTYKLEVHRDNNSNTNNIIYTQVYNFMNANNYTHMKK